MGIVVGAALLSLALFWLPFFTKTGTFWGITFGGQGLQVISQNFDGVNFLIVAKTLYDPTSLSTLTHAMGVANTPLYFTAHYPLFPLLIRLFLTVSRGPYALLYAIVVSNILLAAGLVIFFRAIVSDKKLVLWLSLFALLLPARMLSDRAVGANEPLFLFFSLTSLAAAYKGKHFLAGGLGALAVLTRSPGILLFGGYALAAIAASPRDIRIIVKRIVPYLAIPAALLALVAFYGWRYGSPLAYLNSGVSLNLELPPFRAFGTNESWVSGMWRDDIWYVYLLFGMGMLPLVSKLKLGERFERLVIPLYGAIYYVSLFFVAHRDIARYSLPLAPLVILGFSPWIARREVRWLLLLLLIPVYLLGWQFVLQNVQPIADWTPLL